MGMRRDLEQQNQVTLLAAVGRPSALISQSNFAAGLDAGRDRHRDFFLATIPRQIELCFPSPHGRLQRQLQLVPNVGAFLRGCRGSGLSPRPTRSPWTGPAASENLLEKIPKSAFKSACTGAATTPKYLIEIEALKRGTARAGMKPSSSANLFEIRAVSIIGRPFVVIAQNIVGFLNPLETLLRFAVVGVFVRMKLDRQLSMSLFDVVFRRVSANAKDLIEVFGHSKNLIGVEIAGG